MELLSGLDVLMPVMFVGGLIWLIVDIAVKDMGIFGAMFRDSESFARASVQRKHESRMTKSRPIGEVQPAR